MTFDHLKTWEELTNEEQWDFEDDCQTRAVKEEKKYCKRMGLKFDPAHITRVHTASEEWYFRHMEAKQNAYIEANMTPEQRAKAEEKMLKKELAKAKRQLAKLTL